MVGDVTYAVRIELVREIVNPLDLVELPRAPKSVRGVASFRGDVVPVVDLRDRFGLPPIAPTRRNKWIIVDIGRVPLLPGADVAVQAQGRFAALVVDSVTEVFGTGGADIRPAPPLGAGDDLRGIEGVTDHHEVLVFVLDVRAFGALTKSASEQGVLALRGAGVA